MKKHDIKRKRTKRPARHVGTSVPATEAQNNFGRVLGQVARDGVVYITKYDRPTAVILSIEKFETLAGLGSPGLDELTREFDVMVARMQTDQAAAGANAFFGLGSEALGEAARRGAQQDRT